MRDWPAGVLDAGEVAMLGRIYDDITAEGWFSPAPEAREEFAGYILRMYCRGMVDPHQLRQLCIVAARRRYITVRSDHSRARILVVEDDFLIAYEVVEALNQAGAIVIGPVSNVDDAIDLLEGPVVPTGALLDIRLNKGNVFPVAKVLDRRGIPFAFLTSYQDRAPESLGKAPTFYKPLDINRAADFIASC